MRSHVGTESGFARAQCRILGIPRATRWIGCGFGRSDLRSTSSMGTMQYRCTWAIRSGSPASPPPPLFPTVPRPSPDRRGTPPPPVPGADPPGSGAAFPGGTSEPRRSARVLILTTWRRSFSRHCRVGVPCRSTPVPHHTHGPPSPGRRIDRAGESGPDHFALAGQFAHTPGSGELIDDQEPPAGRTAHGDMSYLGSLSHPVTDLDEDFGLVTAEGQFESRTSVAQGVGREFRGHEDQIVPGYRPAGRLQPDEAPRLIDRRRMSSECT